MDLLEVLGLSRPVADCAVCFEIYFNAVSGQQGGSAAELDALRLRCVQLLQPYVESYIWQHEPFNLQSSLQQQPPWLLKHKGKRHPHEQQPKRHQSDQQQQQQQQPPFLWGVVRYEDSVEDEWFVVWLLMWLTQQLPGCTARCWDDDGEFLLIEAAYSLPRWLKPETASNRVWLHAGQLHIIPPPSDKAPTLPASPSVAEALAVLRSGVVQTRRKKVEACVLERVSGYPQQAQQQVQRTTAWLPRRLGLLLQEDPQLVAGAVAAFMTRQREEVQAVARSPLFPPTDMTTAAINLNRCMYAQLMQADFAPPKTYPSPPGDSWLGGDSARQHKAVGMGVKIATGMELIALRLGLTGAQQQQQQQHNTHPDPQQQQQQQQAQVHADQQHHHHHHHQTQTLADPQQQQQQKVASLSSNPAWHAYKAVLQRSGYFDGELEGSARYRQLLAAAEAAFTGSGASERSNALLEAPKQRLQQLLAAVDAAAAAGGGSSTVQQGVSLQQQQRLPLAAVLDVDRVCATSAAAAVAEDGDEWMASEAEQLQQRLEQAELLAAAHSSQKQQRQQQGSTAAASAGGRDTARGAVGREEEGMVEIDAEQLASGFRGFVQHKAGVEGAEVPAATSAAASATASAIAGVSAAKPHRAGQKDKEASSSNGVHSKGQQHQHQHQQNIAKQREQATAAAVAGVAGLEFNPDAFLSELMGVLGAIGDPLQQQQQQQQTPEQAHALLQQARMLQQTLEQQLAASPDDETAFATAAAAGGGATSAASAAAAAGAAGGWEDGTEGDSDDYGSSGSSSSDEGSSFYGSDSEGEGEGEQGVSGLGTGGDVPSDRGVQSGVRGSLVESAKEGLSERDGPVLLEVPPPCSSRSAGAAAAQQQQQQQQQQGGQRQRPQQEGQQQQRGRMWGQEDAWEVMTATDSDDDEDALSLGGSSDDGSGDGGSSDAGGDGDGGHQGVGVGGFFESYGAALDAELAATTMAQTFEKVQFAPPAAAAEGKASSAAAAAAAEGADGGLTPLDVDYNLIKSLVASYTAQGGLPGPASNLAGLLGLQLPTEPEAQQQQQDQQ